MAAPTTLYAVTSGSYSDYRVEVLFTTRELAEQHLAARKTGRDGWYDTDVSIEEFVLLDRPPERHTVITRSGRVSPDGDVVNDHTSTEVEWEYGHIYGPAKPLMGARTYTAPAWPGAINVEVRGTSKGRVEKAFQDRMAAARAQQLGVSA